MTDHHTPTRWVLADPAGKRVAGPFTTQDAAASYGLLVLGDTTLSVTPAGRELADMLDAALTVASARYGGPEPVEQAPELIVTDESHRTMTRKDTPR